MIREYFPLLLVALILTAGCAKNPASEQDKLSKAPLFENMGSHTYGISTNSALAQRYFNKGLNLTYGFNHAEAGRFLIMQRCLIPDVPCATGVRHMCWGLI